MNVTLPCILTNNKKCLVVNLRNLESDEHAQEIKDLIDNTEDINELRLWIHIFNLGIQIESFCISWEGPSRQKKKTKRDSKEINKLFQEQQEELDNLLEEGFRNSTLKYIS